MGQGRDKGKGAINIPEMICLIRHINAQRLIHLM